MRDAARLFLDRRMTRRGFVSRLTAAGVAASAASGLSTSLEAGQTSKSPGAAPGRVLNDATGGEVMAEFLIDWNVPYVFGLAGSEEVGFLDALVDRVKLQCVQDFTKARSWPWQTVMRAHRDRRRSYRCI